MNKHKCETFSSLNEGNSERGFSILEEIEFGAPRFKIQFRSIKSEEESLFAEVMKTGVEKGITNISVSGEIGIKFCPWCGVDLAPADGSLPKCLRS